MELQSTRRRAAGRSAPLVALVLACFLLAGCSAAGSSDAESPADGGAIPGRDLGSSEDGGGTDEGAPDADRQVVSTASLSLTSNDPVAAADSAVEIVLDVDGHVDNRTDTPTDDFQEESSQLVLRVPSADLDATMVELKTVGELVRSSLSQTDVTTQVVDLDARITALETSVARLLTLMSQATTTADLIDLESALSQRQTELDGLSAQRDALGDLVDFATVEMYISTPGEVAGAAPGDFWGGIVVGFQSLIAFFGGLLVVVGVILPWLIPVGLLALLIWWLVRRRDHASTAPPAQSGPGATAQDIVPPRPPLPPRQEDAGVDGAVR
jgi:hypothetical protein